MDWYIGMKVERMTTAAMAPKTMRRIGSTSDSSVSGVFREHSPIFRDDVGRGLTRVGLFQ